MRYLIFYFTVLLSIFPSFAFAENAKLHGAALISVEGLSNEELLNFLYREDIDSSLVGLAFEVLSRRGVGQRTLETAIDLMISKHLELVEQGIADKSFSEEIQRLLWSVRSRLPVKENYLLARSISDKGVDAFLQDLSVADVHQDSKTLSELIQANVSSDTKLFSDLRQYVEKCSQGLDCEQLPLSFTPEAIKYASRLQNSVVSRAIIEKKISGLLALGLLAKTKYLDHRTPETHQALLLLLKDLVPFDRVWKKLSPDEHDFISFMSKNDTRIAQLVYQNPEWSWLNWAIGLSFSILASGAALFFFTGRKESFSETVTLKKDLDEINEIWSFFNLSPSSNLRDLKRRYRELARELHPDSGCKDSDEFLTLNDYYKRAIQLLKQ